MPDSVTSKDALFMLDMDIDEEMKSYGEEMTDLVVKHINSTPELYKFIKGNLEYKLSIKDSATTWASSHGNEFGPLFQTELDVVKWGDVEKRI